MEFDDEKVKAHFAVWEWLLANFGGMEAMQKRRLITPTPQFFPLRPRYEHAYVEEVFAAVKEYMGIADWPCRLEPLGSLTAPDHSRLADGEWRTSAAGTFQRTDQEVVVRYAPQIMQDPIKLVATLVHELCHYLLGTAVSEPPGGWRNHEFHTDTACGFMGFGIFQSNAAFVYHAWTSGDGRTSSWSTSRLGYLSESEHAYGLALFCELTGTDMRTVEPFLKTNPKAYLKAAMQDLRDRDKQLSRLKSIVDGAVPPPESEAVSHEANVSPVLGLDDVRELTFDTPESEPMWTFYLDLVGQQAGDSWPAKEFAALALLHESLRNAVLAIRFEILQRSDGLQGAVLLEGEDIVADSERMLRLTSDAFLALKDEPRSIFVLALCGDVKQHMVELAAAERYSRIDEFVSPLDQDDDWISFDYLFTHELRSLVKWSPEGLVFPRP